MKPIAAKMNGEQNNVNFNDSSQAVLNDVTSNIPDDGGIVTVNRTKKSRSRSRWGNKRPALFAESTPMVHFSAPFPTTPKERAACSFEQKTVINHTNGTTKSQNAVEVS